MKVEVCAHESSEEEKFGEDEVPWVIRHPGWTNLGLLLLYFLLGIWNLTLLHEFRASTAAYVMVQIITTIGYGDVTVSDNAGKAFMTVYVLVGTLLVSKVVNDLCQLIVDLANKRLEQNLQRLEAAMATRRNRRCAPHLRNLCAAVLIYIGMVAAWVSFFVLFESCSCSYGVTRLDGCEEKRCVASGGSKKTIIVAIYMAVVTFSTVGFGDFVPRSELGRLLACVWMVLGVLAFVRLVAAVSESLAAWRRSHGRLNFRGFRQIDEDGDGEISRAEFQFYMLYHQGRVTEQQMQQLDRLFDRIDQDGTGRLSFAEILAALADLDLQ